MHRPGNPGSPFSPSFTPTAFHAAAAEDGGADVSKSEQPCVSLYEWWLAKVEGDDRKIAVAGFFQRNHEVLEFTPAPIKKRHAPCTLETEDGVVVFIYGSFRISRTLDNGFPLEICENFSIGFPHWWENWSVLYPKITSSGAGSQPNSFGTSNSRGDSTQFYLEQFQQGKFIHSIGSFICELNRAESFSGNGADAFPDSSHLPDGTPRFEEYTCDDDIPTIETAAVSNHGSERDAGVCIEIMVESFSGIGADAFPGSSRLPDGTPRFEEYTCDGDIPRTETAAVSNNGGERDADVCNEVDNVEIDLMPGSTLKGRDHGGINSNVSSVPTVDCTIDEGNVGEDNTPCISKDHQKTPLASLKRRGFLKKPLAKASNEKAVPDEGAPTPAYSDVRSLEKPAGPPKKQISAREKLQRATRSPTNISPVPNAQQSRLTRSRAKSLSLLTPESVKLRKTSSGRIVVPALDLGCQRIVYDQDGSISAVTGISPPPLKGSTVKTYTRKKKRAH